MQALADHEISRFPSMEHACVPGSSTTPGRPSACVVAPGHIAFRYTDSVGTRNQFSIAAQWLGCTFPYRRFADILANACARLGADVVRYSFIVVDLHHLLLAGLPAHLCENALEPRIRRIVFSIAFFRQKVAGAIGFRIDEIETKILHESSMLEFSHSLGHFQTSARVTWRSALPPITDIVGSITHIWKVP
jgi:hypothetical protein